MQIFSAIASTRVDLAGGTLDLWPIHQMIDRKATVNFSVPLYQSARVFRSDKFTFKSVDQNQSITGSYQELIGDRQLPLLAALLKHFWPDDGVPITIETQAKSPAGAGLGGSSCLAMAVVRALVAADRQWHIKENYEEGWDLRLAVEQVRDIEARVIDAPTGVQDYWGGVSGGLNVLTYPPGQVMVHSERGELFEALLNHFVLVFSGKSRASAMNNMSIFQNFLARDSRTCQLLAQIGEVAEQSAQAVSAHNLEDLLSLSDAEWKLRCQLWPGIETEETQRIDRAAQAKGALFSRVCGAGGGGVMAVFCRPEHRTQVEAAAKAAGGELLSCSGLTSPLELRTE